MADMFSVQGDKLEVSATYSGSEAFFVQCSQGDQGVTDGRGM